MPGTGGTAELLIPVEEGEAAQSPQMLPGGEWVLFTLRPSAATTWDQSQIVVHSLATDERRVLIDGGRDARYVPTGHLVYALEGSLLAVPFDADQLAITPGPVPLVDGVSDGAGRSGTAHFSLSTTGSLAYVPGDGLPGGGGGGQTSALVWVDRDGREEPLPEEPRPYGELNLSPDGTRVAVGVNDPAARDVWIYDLVRDTFTRLTFDAAGDGNPVWTPDGLRVAFHSTPGGLFWRAADGTGQAEPLLENSTFSPPWSFAPDGTTLVMWHPTPGAADLGLLSLEGERASTALLETEFAEMNAVVSPDGRWVAYGSDESGEFEIYVRPFPDVESGRWQVSGGGGRWPVWGPDSDELFYVGPQGMMAATATTEPTFAAGNSVRLFDSAPFTLGNSRSFDIAPDGQRFLMLKTARAQTEVAGETASPQINVVLNWFKELTERVPVQ